MIVLGVDPGAGTTGYGVVVQQGGGAISLLECGVIRTDASDPLSDRLKAIYLGICEVIARHQPAAAAVEGVFYARNVRTSIILGHARGAILLAATMSNVPVHEYSPAEIKNAVVGHGRAGKEQVQFMIQQMLRLKTVPQPADAADGIAVALCHCNAAQINRLKAAVFSSAPR
ncbi:MAG: crossover junction endodeoxyribonuclease RuvC [Gemmatimonadota bacterium]